MHTPRKTNITQQPKQQNNTIINAPAACIEMELGEDDDDVGAPFRHLEIVSLHEASNGRSCHNHQCCGKLVKVGDILLIKKTVVDIPTGSSEKALALTLVEGGEEKCRVAFLPRFVITSKLVHRNIEKLVQVVELFGQSKNTTKQQKDRQYCGVAGVVIMNEIPSEA